MLRRVEHKSLLGVFLGGRVAGRWWNSFFPFSSPIFSFVDFSLYPDISILKETVDGRELFHTLIVHETTFLLFALLVNHTLYMATSVVSRMGWSPDRRTRATATSRKTDS